MTDSILRAKYLFEYQLKGNNKSYPTFEEYKEQNSVFLEEEDGDKNQESKGVSEPASDGNSTIPDPDEVPNNNNQVNNDNKPNNNQHVDDNKNDKNNNQHVDDIIKKLEDKISNQEVSLNKILNILSPEPEETPEDKIIKKIDSLSKEVEGLKNINKIKRDEIKNIAPFNVTLKQMWEKSEEDENKDLTISQSDIENYDPTYIKKTLGISNNLSSINHNNYR